MTTYTDPEVVTGDLYDEIVRDPDYLMEALSEAPESTLASLSQYERAGDAIAVLQLVTEVRQTHAMAEAKRRTDAEIQRRKDILADEQRERVRDRAAANLYGGA